jgi:Rhs element Vgr protein
VPVADNNGHFQPPEPAMPKSPLLNSEGRVHLSVRSNGQPIAESIAVTSVHVHRAVGNIPTARLVIDDGNLAGGEWPVADGPSFQPGARISVAAGYGDHEQTLFEGIVIQLGMQISGDNASRLVVDCSHPAVKMTVGRNNAHHADVTDSEVIRGLVQAHSLKAEVDATGERHDALTQYYCTDWDFIVSRAEVNGLLVIVDDDKVLVQAPRTSAEPVLRVEYGIDLIDFQAEVDSRSQLQAVRTVAWDPRTQAVVEGSPATPRTLNAQGNLDPAALAAVMGPTRFRLQTSVPLQADELSAWGQAQQVKAGLARIRGRMKFQGSASAKVGSLIEIAGVGARYSGNVFVAAVEHEIADGNWLTTAGFGVAPDWHCERDAVVAPAAAGWLPGAEGLQIGIVTQVGGDPADAQRIQIRLPVLQATTETVWARLLQFHASNGFGAFFMPEVGDEVVVAFFNHDPSHPVVLGSLYSSRRKPADGLEPSNDIKALVTRSRHRLEFDEKDRIITVTTPANNQVVLSDRDRSIVLKDQNGNSVALNAGGVSIDTPKDLRIAARGTVTIEALGAVTIGSKADLKCSGLNIACEAEASFSGTGLASAELSAAGQTIVKGAMVLIN